MPTRLPMAAANLDGRSSLGRCHECNEPGAKLKCGRCHVMFCSYECMKKSWSSGAPHREFCEELATVVSEFLRLVSNEFDADSCVGVHKRSRDEVSKRDEPEAKRTKRTELTEFVDARRADVGFWTTLLFQMGLSDFLDEPSKIALSTALSGRMPEVTAELATVLMRKDPRAFSRLCRAGCLRCVQFLTYAKVATAKDVRDDRCAAFRQAIIGGHVDVVEFLASRFPFAIVDVGFYKLLDDACVNGHLPVVKLLVENSGIPDGDLQLELHSSRSDSFTLYRTIANGHTDVLEYLVEHIKYVDLRVACSAARLAPSEICKKIVDFLIRTGMAKPDNPLLPKCDR